MNDSAKVSTPISSESSAPVEPEKTDNASLIAAETVATIGAGTVGAPDRSKPKEVQTGRHAAMVGAGILISRVVGLVRQRVFAYYFGDSAAADAFTAAFRIPNFLQNVFGEGALSASFIPVYARLLASDDEDEADRVAWAVFTLLALVVSVLVLAGVFASPLLINAIAMGFEGEKRDLTERLV